MEGGREGETRGGEEGVGEEEGGEEGGVGEGVRRGFILIKAKLGSKTMKSPSQSFKVYR